MSELINLIADNKGLVEALLSFRNEDTYLEEVRGVKTYSLPSKIKIEYDSLTDKVKENIVVNRDEEALKSKLSHEIQLLLEQEYKVVHQGKNIFEGKLIDIVLDSFGYYYMEEQSEKCCPKNLKRT